jgi:glycerol-3-phosphate dehydrogenase
MNAKYVVNCTGVWADKLRLMDNPHAKKRICLVGGSHIVYDRRLASDSFGLTAPSADGRVILVQPWLGRVLAGTTEKKYLEPTNHPICSE